MMREAARSTAGAAAMRPANAASPLPAGSGEEECRSYLCEECAKRQPLPKPQRSAELRRSVPERMHERRAFEPQREAPRGQRAKGESHGAILRGAGTVMKTWSEHPFPVP